MPAKPQTLLACQCGPAQYAVRYFETVNGGQPNDKPYVFQKLSGDWFTIKRFAEWEDAAAEYERYVQKLEQRLGPRTKFHSRKWTVGDIPPALAITGADLIATLSAMAEAAE